MRKRICVALLLSLTLLLTGPSIRRAAAEAGRAGGDGVPAAESHGGFFRSLSRFFGGGRDKKDEKKEKPAGKAEPRSAAPDPAEAATPTPVKVERTDRDDARKFEVRPVSRAAAADSGPSHAETFEASEASAHVARGRSLLSQSKYYEASVELAAAVALDPGRGEAHNLLGVALDGRGSHELAVGRYKQALRLLPDDPQVLNNLGYSYFLADDFSSARKYLQKAARRAPRDERVLNNLAAVQYRLGRKKDALESFVRASDPFTGRMNLAALLSRFGNHAEAAELYEEAHRLDPRSARPLEMMAGAYERMGRTADAEGVRRAAAALKLNGGAAASNGN